MIDQGYVVRNVQNLDKSKFQKKKVYNAVIFCKNNLI